MEPFDFLDFMEESKAVGERCGLSFPSTSHQREDKPLGKEGTKMFIKKSSDVLANYLFCEPFGM